jgi:hypothetical protein
MIRPRWKASSSSASSNHASYCRKPVTLLPTNIDDEITCRFGARGAPVLKLDTTRSATSASKMDRLPNILYEKKQMTQK